MRAASKLIVCAVMAITGAERFLWAQVAPPEMEVAIRVGKVRVRLNVREHFAHAASRLPKPAELPVTDEHDRMHEARTYCYRYSTRRGLAVLEFHDSTFGLHTATLSRPPEEQHKACTPLSSAPEFVVGAARYSLDSEITKAPAGFQLRNAADAVTLTREWTYSNPSELQLWGTCVSRSVSITVKPGRGASRSLTVQNWEEPGC